nr:hypothetical protein [Tanacetum cinerariifolium]
MQRVMTFLKRTPLEVVFYTLYLRYVWRHAPGRLFRRNPIWGCDRLVSKAKFIEKQEESWTITTHRLALRYISDYSSSNHFTSDDSSQDSPLDSPLETSSDSHADTSSDSSSRHSSSGYAISDSLFDLLTAISTEPSCKRCSSPTTSVLAALPIPGALSPVRADLLPPRKRIRDSDFVTDLEVSLEEGYVPYVPREIGLGVDVEDSYEPYIGPDIDPDLQADIDACITFVDDIADDTAEPVGEDSPELVSADGFLEVKQRGLNVVMQELYHHMVEISVHRVRVIESV